MLGMILATVFAQTGNEQPKPFLTIPLAKGTPNVRLSQGWVYSEDERRIHPSIPIHFAVDFATDYGANVYAPADGLAVASYHTYDMLDSHHRTIGFGLGLFVAIWHEQAQVYTMYAHLSQASNQVPYIAPVKQGTNWQPRVALYVPVDQFKQQTKPVKKGDLIGQVGYSGLRLGYEEEPHNPVRIDPQKHRTWDPHGAHLHWEVYNRTPDGDKKDKRYDPFGLYQERQQYAGVLTKARGLILANPDGSPRFAK